MRLNRLTSLLFCALAGLAVPAAAQPSYPAKPLRVIVPFTSGGATDQVARILASKVSERLGVTLVIDNKPGANGNLGAEFAAKAKPDGYTLLHTTSAIAYTQAFGQKVGYVLDRDLAPVSLLIDQPLLIVASRQSGITDSASLLSLGRAGNLSYASSGIGNLTHLAMHVVLGTSGISAVHVPYKGGAGAFPDVIAGRVDLLADPINSAYRYARDHRVTPLAVTSKERSALLPEVPTVSEALAPGFTMGAWQALLVPAGTPGAVVETLHSAYAAALADPEVRAKLAAQGAIGIGSAPPHLSRFVAAEVRRWSAIVRQSGIRLE